jgi:DNA-binding XRE family transcriptional regulator
VERNVRVDWSAIVKEAIIKRKEQGLTQEQLAVIAGVSKPTLNAFERGALTLKIESSLRILCALGLGKR